MANILALPGDESVLKTVGKISIAHSQLDYVLRLAVKTILNISLQEARDATRRQSSSQLRDLVRKLAKQKLGECEELVRLRALLTRAERATEKRNRLIHNISYQNKRGVFVIKDDNQPSETYPTNIELTALLREIQVVAADLNDARLSGFLAVAIQRKSQPK